MSLPFTLRITDKNGTRTLRVPSGMAKMEVQTANEEDYIGTVVITDLKVSMLPNKANLLATLELTIIDIVCDKHYQWVATDQGGGSYTDGLGNFYLVGVGDSFLIKQ